ncbi:unnamed protein product [Symbiodinium sp. CCMP2592]|nr:unnamed protein product [Symbiodinium sp. CCMP2592]
MERAGGNKKAKKSTQELSDVGPFLSEADVACISNRELNTLARVTRLGLVFSRVGCTNPTEQSRGRATSFLKSHMGVAELSEPSEFLKSAGSDRQVHKCPEKSKVATQARADLKPLDQGS